jgi:hypothetical protein
LTVVLARGLARGGAWGEQDQNGRNDETASEVMVNHGNLLPEGRDARLVLQRSRRSYALAASLASSLDKGGARWQINLAREQLRTQ